MLLSSQKRAPISRRRNRCSRFLRQAKINFLFFLCLAKEGFEVGSGDSVVHQGAVLLTERDHPDDLAVCVEDGSAGIAADRGGGIHDIPLSGNDVLPVADDAVQHTDALPLAVSDGVDLFSDGHIARGERDGGGRSVPPKRSMPCPAARRRRRCRTPFAASPL